MVSGWASRCYCYIVYSDSRDELLGMLRTLLGDRFKLSLHRDIRELMADVLMVAKSGAKLNTQ